MPYVLALSPGLWEQGLPDHQRELPVIALDYLPFGAARVTRGVSLVGAP